MVVSFRSQEKLNSEAVVEVSQDFCFFVFK